MIAALTLVTGIIYYRIKVYDVSPTWVQYLCGHVAFSMYLSWLLGALEPTHTHTHTNTNTHKHTHTTAKSADTHTQN